MRVHKEKEYSDFWGQLLSKCEGRTTIFSKCRGTRYNRLGAKHNGVYYQCNLRENDSEVHVYIDFGLKTTDGKKAAARNLSFYESLWNSKNDIEQKFGNRLVWIGDEDDYRRRCIKYILPFGLSQKKEWNTLQMKMITAIIRIERVLHPYLADET
jgi:hypothetical protein